MADCIRLDEAGFRPGDILVQMAHYPDGRAVSNLAAGIAAFGRGCDAYHVAVLTQDPSRAWCATEMVAPMGREVPIRERVRTMPGTVHWLRVPDLVVLDYAPDEGPRIRRYCRDAAVAKAREYIGVAYGFDTIRRAYMAESWARWWAQFPADDAVVDWKPVCSVCALDSVQTGYGWDLIRRLNTACATPWDLYRLSILEDMGPLVL